MIRVTVIYQDRPGGRFDQHYHLHRHLPTVVKMLHGMPGFIEATAERSFDASNWGASLALITCHYTFDSLPNAMLALGDLAAEMRADIPNFSSIEPIVYVNETICSHSADGVLTSFGDTSLAGLPSSWLEQS